MSEQPYTNREIDTLHNALVEKMTTHNENTMTVLDEIKTQTKKTNGRVTVLEKFMYLASGAIAVLSIKEIASFLGGGLF